MSTCRAAIFPTDLADYKLVIHCGACMWNRREMLSRILRCQQAGVPITNYGLTIAYSLGIFERALAAVPGGAGILSEREKSNGRDALPRVRADRQVSPTETKRCRA